MDVKVASALQAYKVHNSQPVQKKPMQTHRAEMGKDTFTMSIQVGDYVTVRKALASVPDIREEKVARIAALVAEGAYEINADAIAAKLMS
jgi:flagellar biosynthesis anti-sigma factor FlgM